MAEKITKNNEFQRYLDSPSESSFRGSEETYVEVPSPLPPKIEKAASGYAPMDRIALQGQAYRGLASGSQPWWVIIAGWIVFGLPCLSIVVVMATTGGWVAYLGAIALCAIFLWIMYRGTKAKLARQKEQHQRKAKYRSEMSE